MNIKHTIYIMLATSLIVILSTVKFVLANEEAYTALGTVKELELNQGSPAVFDAETDFEYSDIYDRLNEWNVVDTSSLEAELVRLRTADRRA